MVDKDNIMNHINQTFIALDLETTGLDPETDQIIEIGVVKFQGDRNIDTFHTLVNPHCPIPYRVRWLTGITQAELETAPSIASVIPDLVLFAEDHPIVGQNISFDLSFLSAQNVRLSTTSYDAFEMANIVLPCIQDHSLSALALELGIPTPVQHRALSDAITAMGVFTALLDRITHLHPNVISELNRLTAMTHQPWHTIIANLRNKTASQDLRKYRNMPDLRFVPSFTDQPEETPLMPKSDGPPLDISQLTQFLEQNGPMAKSFPSFEYRPGQVSMMKAVAESMNTGQSLIAEVGTGTGKSIAYLLPAISFALQHDSHVILSTNTINLQEQLMNKDIPTLLEVMNVPQTCRIAQLKGRTNYLCLKQFNARRQEPALTWEEAKFLLRLAVWISSPCTGDRSELGPSRDDALFWNTVCASRENCSGEQCPYYKEHCFLYRARQKAEISHIVVVNHALLLSDLANTHSILPEYRHAIIDEAHHLEKEATEQLGFRVTQWDLLGYLDRLGEKGGFLSHLQNWLRTSPTALPSQLKEAKKGIRSLGEQIKATRSLICELFKLLTSFSLLYATGQESYEQQLSVTPSTRHTPNWNDIEVYWEELNTEMKGIEEHLDNLSTTMENIAQGDWTMLYGLVADLMALLQKGKELRRWVNEIIANPDTNYIYWLSLKEQEEAVLHAAPLNVGQVLEKLFFSKKECAVLTSATLTTGGSFDYVKESLGLKNAVELTVDAPFDYLNSALIYLPQGIPEPNRPGYQKMVEQSLIDLCRATRGRTLILFTSHAALRATRATLQPPLEEEGILVLGQGVDGSPKQLLNIFKTNPKTVLLGTASLWEGIDIVGDALSVVVIAKLPFSVPSDPIFSARSELFEDPFNEYGLPLAIIKFKQGFGRLIRSKQDRGAMVVLDQRIQTRSYGKVMLESLPVCTIKRGPLRYMPREVTEWLNK